MFVVWNFTEFSSRSRQNATRKCFRRKKLAPHAVCGKNFARSPINPIMSIRIQCPQCLEKYSAGEEYIGKRFECRCGALIEVPELSSLFPAAEAQAPGKPAGKAAAPKESASKIPPPETNTPKAEPPPQAQSGHAAETPGTTIYGLLAVLFATTGLLSFLATGVFAFSAVGHPLLGTTENDCLALLVAFAAFTLAFLLAALFRLTDLAVRRSGIRCFF